MHTPNGYPDRPDYLNACYTCNVGAGKIRPRVTIVPVKLGASSVTHVIFSLSLYLLIELCSTICNGPAPGGGGGGGGGGRSIVH